MAQRVLTAIGTLAACVAIAFAAVVPNLAPKRFAEVVPGVLYRAGEGTPAAIRRVVEQHDIRTIIDLGAHERGSPEDDLAQRTADALGVRRVRFDLYGDSRGDPNDYLDALRIATDPANHPVLVHCGAGVQRTGCFVALHRHITEGWSLEQAYDEAVRHGHDPDDPGSHVRAMLHRWAEPVARAYRDGGAIPFDPQRDQVGPRADNAPNPAPNPAPSPAP